MSGKYRILASGALEIHLKLQKGVSGVFPETTKRLSKGFIIICDNNLNATPHINSINFKVYVLRTILVYNTPHIVTLNHAYLSLTTLERALLKPF